VSDLESARRILEAIGYQVITMYEKYRTSYLLGKTEISLDEMPYGSFIEIEGPEETAIQDSANHLHLKWENRTNMSYLRIFSNLKECLGLNMRDLTFNVFSGHEIQPDHLQLEFAD